MSKRTYICTVTSDNMYAKVYRTTTKSAMKAAKEFGRCDGGEEVNIWTPNYRLVSSVKWTPENGGRYYRTMSPLMDWD